MPRASFDLCLRPLTPLPLLALARVEYLEVHVVDPAPIERPLSRDRAIGLRLRRGGWLVVGSAGALSSHARVATPDVRPRWRREAGVAAASNATCSMLRSV